MIEIKTYGELKDGAFYPRDSKRHLQQMKESGNANHVLLSIKGGNKRTLDQNAYAWVVCRAIALRMRQDGWNITPANIYRKVEQTHCHEQAVNEQTGKTMDVLTPLKEQPTDKFHDIIEKVRVGHMQNYPDNPIKTPAQYYDITEEAYDLWRLGKIHFGEAKKMSKKAS